MSEWKPIETAPNGQTILIARRMGDGAQYIELVDACDNDYDWTPWKNDGIDRPTHWMEPPALPKLSKVKRAKGKPGSQE
jgi:hypothetical protein